MHVHTTVFDIDEKMEGGKIHRTLKGTWRVTPRGNSHEYNHL